MQHLDAESVATRYGLSRNRLDDLVRFGEFPTPLRLGGRRLWTVAQLDAFDAALLAKAEKAQAEKAAAAPAKLAVRNAKALARRAKAKALKAAAKAAQADEDPFTPPEPAAAPQAVPKHPFGDRRPFQAVSL